ncbi:MAG TPA: 6-phosphofructokinase [Holophaga sp.]|nr:6-phosphofructokinase [Holophaga sp.]
MRLGLLTGGGDVPGLNPCIKTLVRAAAEEGIQVLGLRRGWAGLLHFNPEDPESSAGNLQPLDTRNTRTIDRTGGTFLHTSRVDPAAVRPRDLPSFLAHRALADDPVDCTDHILRVVEHLKLDGLVALGGDGTLSFAERLFREGVPVLAIPKTMDNDVHGTDYCIGFSTAVTRSVEFIHQLRTTAGSHERIAIVELYGRYCGETSLLASYLAGVDRAIISEVPFDPERLAELALRDKRDNPSNYVMITMSEGASMQGGGPVGLRNAEGFLKLGGIGAVTGETLRRLTGENVICQQVSYLMRSGAPDSLDLMVAVNFAETAIGLAVRRAWGRMIALKEGRYTSVPLDVLREGRKRVDVDELYDASEYRPKVRHVEGKPMFLY